MPDIVRAIISMIIAMAFLTISDVFIKLLSPSVSTGAIVFFLGLGTTLFFATSIKLQRGPIFSWHYFHWTVVLRNIGEVTAALGMVISLTYVPLVTVTALLQSQPLLLTAAGAVFLGEKVGVRRLAAVLLGFCGVMIIMRPGAEDFSIYSLLTIIALLGMVIRDIGARLAPQTVPTLPMALYGSMVVSCLGLVMMMLSDDTLLPSGIVWLYVFGMAIASSVGIFFITRAMRLGEVSAISPFRYVKIIFGIGAGILLLDEQVDAAMLVGSTIVTVAGIYAFMRERQIAAQKK